MMSDAPTQTAQTEWDELPTETEIYILPTGEIVVADLPAELAATLDPALIARAVQPDHDHAQPYPTAPTE